MNIEGIQLLKTLPVSWQDSLAVQPAAGTSFQDIMVNSLKSINEEQIEVQDSIKTFLKGEGLSVHEVMLKSEEAKLSLEFAVQLRNKVLEAYNEVMRMQV